MHVHDKYLAANFDMCDARLFTRSFVNSNRDDEVARFTETLSHQVTVVLSLVLQQLLSVATRNVTVEPSVTPQILKKTPHKNSWGVCGI